MEEKKEDMKQQETIKNENININVSTETKFKKYFGFLKKIFLTILSLAATFFIYLKLTQKDPLKKNKEKIRQNLEEIENLKTDIFLKEKEIQKEKEELNQKNLEYEKEKSNINEETKNKIDEIKNDNNLQSNIEYFKNRYGNKE